MSSSFNLDGMNAVVTGGSQGIGAAIAVRLRDAGASVHVADINECVDSSFGFTKTDVSDETAIKKLMQEAAESLGPIDVLVNNAGIHRNYDHMSEATEEDFDRCFDVNTKGVAYGIKHVLPHMRSGGSIINVSSVSAVLGVGGLGTYTASKAAVIGLTKVAAVELAHKKIRVNAICPGSVNTPMALEDGGEALLTVEAKATPLGRICEPDEVAALVHFLAAPDCSFITGQAINICGGLTAGLSENLWSALLENQE
jgi:NAD(P)-dependent dehydrogenase (short-subunit alcohol dehydrogenase family)